MSATCTRCGKDLDVIYIRGHAVVSPSLVDEVAPAGSSQTEEQLCRACLLAELSPERQVLADQAMSRLAESGAYWDAALGPITPGLADLVSAVARAGTSAPVDFQLSKRSIETLLELLASPAGRTRTNCAFTADTLSRISNWEQLPEPYRTLMRLMSAPLGSAASAVESAAWYPTAIGATPERLLDTARALPVSAEQLPWNPTVGTSG